MAAYEFDVLNSRPHFPGYPIFCFLSQIILILTDNIALTFSLIGSISTFIIIYYCDKIWQFYFQKQSLFFITILFFNPFMWLMSNRYMPDLFALSLLVTGTYYLIKILKKTSKKNNWNKKWYVWNTNATQKTYYYSKYNIIFFRCFF